MNDTTSLFSQYEREYCSKSTEISRKLDGLSTLNGDLRKRKVSELDLDLKEAESALKKLDFESRSLAPSVSVALQPKVKDYKADLASLKAQFQQVKATTPADVRLELGLGGEFASASQAQRERLLSSTAMLENTSSRLESGKRLLVETEEIGAGILRDLHSQRQTLVHARDTLFGADEGINKARTVLSSMSRRMFQHKIIMYGVVAMLAGAIIFILYMKLH